MEDYSEIVKDLRDKFFAYDATGNHKSAQFYKEAADAFEALQAKVERLKEINDELREKQTYIDHYGDKWMTSAKDVPTAAYKHGYADGFAEAKQAIEKLTEYCKELQHAPSYVQNMPKRGEWVKNEDRYGWHCSCCKVDNRYAYKWNSETMRNEIQDKYCPNCGAKMEAQNES